MTDTRPIFDLESFDFAALEERVIMICGIDPASLAGDRTAVMAALYGSNRSIVIIDEGHLATDAVEQVWDQNRDGLLDDEFMKAFRGIKDVKPVATVEFKPDNRKQRRIDEAKERRKPRGQRKKLIMDIESYDSNRAKDWLR